MFDLRFMYARPLCILTRVPCFFKPLPPLPGDEKNRVRSTRISFRNDDASRNKNVRRMNADEAFDKSNRVLGTELTELARAFS